MDDNKNNKLLSVKEAHEYIGVCRSTFDAWVRDGEIVYHMVGKRKKFKVKDLEDYLNRTKVDMRPQVPNIPKDIDGTPAIRNSHLIRDGIKYPIWHLKDAISKGLLDGLDLSELDVEINQENIKKTIDDLKKTDSDEEVEGLLQDLPDVLKQEISKKLTDDTAEGD